MIRFDADRRTSKVRLDLAVVRQAKPMRSSEEQVVHRQPGICLPLRPRHALPRLVARVCSRTHRLGVLKGAHVDVQHDSGEQQLRELSRQCSGSLPSQSRVCTPLDQDSINLPLPFEVLFGYTGRETVAAPVGIELGTEVGSLCGPQQPLSAPRQSS
jgi:hypothetical protein